MTFKGSLNNLITKILTSKLTLKSNIIFRIIWDI
jgi:hypothetical protein